MIEHANLIYMPNLNVIGGTEQFVYELAKKYYMYDIAVIYKQGHEKQIERLKRFVRVIKYTNQKFKCKKLFCNYATDICKDVEAEEYIQVIHAMYKTNKLSPVNEPKITKYLAVSNIAKKEYEEITNVKCEVFRNPLTFTEEDKQKPILLISATRLTKEKGKDRMIKLADMLDKANIKWLWLIFTNDTMVINHPNIAYMKPRLDIRPYLQLATYGVQLSDCEGDCYFTRECEALGIPLLVTPIPSFKEQGLVDYKNCYYLPFNMEIDDIDKITNVPAYKGYIGEDHWEKILNKTRTNYKEEINMKFKVRALSTYKELGCTDNELGRIPNEGEIFEVSGERLEILTDPSKNTHNRVFVEEVEVKRKEKENKETTEEVEQPVEENVEPEEVVEDSTKELVEGENEDLPVLTEEELKEGAEEQAKALLENEEKDEQEPSEGNTVEGEAVEETAKDAKEETKEETDDIVKEAVLPKESEEQAIIPKKKKK